MGQKHEGLSASTLSLAVCSSGIAAEALLQPVAVETVELQHFSVKGSNKQTESVLFAPLIEI